MRRTIIFHKLRKILVFFLYSTLDVAKVIHVTIHPDHNVLDCSESVMDVAHISIRSESETTLKYSKYDILEPSIEGIVGPWI